ncbi:MAG: hypothetical protein OIF57_06635 [Marinobacterium sp.]|nr:hypothetical protein [Marinobacterium sp.]
MTDAKFSEIDYLLRVRPDGITHVGGMDGLNNRISDWLDTPEGTVADNPGWGSPLRAFLHEPQSPALEIEIQMKLVQKIRRDVRDVTVRAVSVQFVSIDLIKIVIFHNLGVFEKDTQLSGEGVTSGIT